MTFVATLKDLNAPNLGGGATPPTTVLAPDHQETEVFVATLNQTSFALSSTPVDVNDVSVVVNGAAQTPGADFSVSGTTLTWLDTNFQLDAGDQVVVSYNVES